MNSGVLYVCSVSLASLDFDERVEHPHIFSGKDLQPSGMVSRRVPPLNDLRELGDDTETLPSFLPLPMILPTSKSLNLLLLLNCTEQRNSAPRSSS